MLLCLVDTVYDDSNVVGALAYAVATSLGRCAKAFEHRGAVYVYGFDAEYAGFCLFFVLCFPVGDGRAQELFKASGGLLVGELKQA